MNFQLLADTIQHTHKAFYQHAVKAVNKNLTLRNWLIGCYLMEYEQLGEDRGAYGTKLLASLAERVAVKGISETSLKLCRQFYFTYPKVGYLFKNNPASFIPDISLFQIRQSATNELQDADALSFQELKKI